MVERVMHINPEQDLARRVLEHNDENRIGQLKENLNLVYTTFPQVFTHVEQLYQAFDEDFIYAGYHETFTPTGVLSVIEEPPERDWGKGEEYIFTLDDIERHVEESKHQLLYKELYNAYAHRNDGEANFVGALFDETFEMYDELKWLTRSKNDKEKNQTPKNP